MREAARFFALRKKVMKAIAEQLVEDPCCKSYEGTFEWITCYPNYFEDERGSNGPCYYVLVLHCYVLGPSRHYEWSGKTRDEALSKAEKEINSWLGGGEDG